MTSNNAKQGAGAKIRLILVAFVALATVASIAIFYNFGESQKGNEVIVRLNAPFPAIDFAPFYVAKTKGWLEEDLSRENAKPDYLGSFGEIAISTESLATDRIDFILTSTVPALIGRAAGVDIKVIWLSCTLYSEIVVNKNLDVKAFDDLASLQIGTLTGSDSHFWLHELLADKVEGGLPKFVQLFTRPPDILNAFDAGSIDAIALFPPFNEQRIVTGAAKPVSGPEMPIQVIMIGRNQFIEAHPKVTDALVASLDRAKKWIVANPSEARQIVATETGIPIDVVNLSWTKLDWSAELGPAVAKDMQNKADFFAKNKSLKREVDVAGELIRSLGS